MTWIEKMGEFMMNMDTYSAHYYLKWNMPTDRYLRMQTTSNIGMDKVDQASIDGLIKDGHTLYTENKE